MRAWCRVPRGRRRHRPAGGDRQSPGQDVERSIAVRMIAVAAPGAGESRLALTVRRVGVAAGMALLRGESRIDEDNLNAGCLALVLDPLAEHAPGRSEDPAVQTGLGAGPVGQKGAGLVRVRLRFGLAGHAGDVELLQ